MQFGCVKALTSVDLRRSDSNLFLINSNSLYFFSLLRSKKAKGVPRGLVPSARRSLLKRKTLISFLFWGISRGCGE